MRVWQVSYPDNFIRASTGVKQLWVGQVVNFYQVSQDFQIDFYLIYYFLNVLFSGHVSANLALSGILVPWGHSGGLQNQFTTHFLTLLYFEHFIGFHKLGYHGYALNFTKDGL